MRIFSTLSISLSLLCLSACGPEIPLADNLPTASDSERIARLEQQIEALTATSAPVAEAQAAAASAALSPPSGSLAVTGLQVQPASLSLETDQTEMLELVLLLLEDNSSAVMKDFQRLEFSSNNAAVATINAQGEIQAVGTGSTQLRVALGNLSRTVPVTVSAPTPAADIDDSELTEDTPEPTPSAASNLIEITNVDPQPFEVNVGANKQVNSVLLTLNTAEGESLGLLTNLSAADWSSSDESIARISTSGVVTGVAEGTATMTVEYQGLSRNFTVTVKAANT